MSQGEGRSNRGPAAAQQNRRAVLRAARRLFATRGYRVPLSAIAREAGVGQGVLYRHFPTRLDLALAAFEENFATLEMIASDPGDEAFWTFWERLVDLTIQETAFVEMVVDARAARPDYDGERRLLDLLAPLLARAIEAGLVDAEVTIDDLLLAQRMIFGILATAPDAAEARRAADRALVLLGITRRSLP